MLVEGGDLLHLGVGQGEVEDVEILLRALAVGAFGDGDDVKKQPVAVSIARRRIAARSSPLLLIHTLVARKKVRTAEGPRKSVWLWSHLR